MLAVAGVAPGRVRRAVPPGVYAPQRRLGAPLEGAGCAVGLVGSRSPHPVPWAAEASPTAPERGQGQHQQIASTIQRRT